MDAPCNANVGTDHPESYYKCGAFRAIRHIKPEMRPAVGNVITCRRKYHFIALRDENHSPSHQR
jgi:hypothetical protein